MRFRRHPWRSRPCRDPRDGTGRRIFGVADGEITIASATTPLDVEKRGDSWLIGIDDEHYMVPEAVVHGG